MRRLALRGPLGMSSALCRPLGWPHFATAACLRPGGFVRGPDGCSAESSLRTDRLACRCLVLRCHRFGRVPCSEGDLPCPCVLFRSHPFLVRCQRARTRSAPSHPFTLALALALVLARAALQPRPLPPHPRSSPRPRPCPIPSLAFARPYPCPRIPKRVSCRVVVFVL